ncbi:single-stranded DNA-binding protein [Lewinella sp. JB7]|uniref:single-stranded DNA-binding protein n=1 Tax=Lewinella sp. JB7 TaxID=2962887 RepID=UPI0020C94A15|nr:single-stranded DNA-binding protein [Lewinella sp. JB7]MCP9234480.1 single-stranded DNA-binding protein [Lewinella sp. JB7]
MNVRNSVTLIGNVGQLPICKTLPSGSRVIEFSLATNDTYRNREGEKIDRTEWHRVKAFGKVVDVLERYLTKGTQIALTGALRYNKWTDKHDQQRTTAEIILEEFSFLGSKERNSTEIDAEPEFAEMAVAEPAPKKTTKRRTAKKAERTAVTPAEDLPF